MQTFSILAGPEVLKLFPCSIKISTKFIQLVNVKMSTIVGILTFISMINTTSEKLKARNFFIWRYFPFYMSSWNFMLNCVEYEKSFITSSPRLFSWAGWFASYLMANSEDRFSHIEAYLSNAFPGTTGMHARFDYISEVSWITKKRFVDIGQSLHKMARKMSQ